MTRLYILLIIIAASFLRVWAYGSPKLSIATNDTQSYVEASRVPLFSSEIMTGRRLLSTNLVYKVFEPKDGYQISVNGSIETHRRRLQHGFDRITTLQLVLSLMGWGVLSFVLSEHIRAPFAKYLSAVILMAFAFTPQIADWDSVLMSESLSFSLFALQLAFLIKLVFSMYDKPGTKISPYFTAWAITFFSWSFLRDTNLFASIITVGTTAVLLFFQSRKKDGNVRAILAFTFFILILGLYTSNRSIRSQIQMTNVYKSDLLGSPAGVETLKRMGMPEPDSKEYQAWFQENSSKTLIKYMLLHPGYPTIKLIRDFPAAFTDTKQTYFHAPEQYRTREVLMGIGNALHPENTTPFLLDLLLLGGFIVLAAKNEVASSQPWAWLALWLFLTATLMLISAILGDAWALIRHALLPTTMYRLFMWIFTLVLMDIAISRISEQNNPPSQG